MKYGIVFPGQGSQYVGMLSQFKNNPIIKETFNKASEILNYDLWNLIQNGPKNKLNKTYKTQPAILTSSIAIYKLWEQKIKYKPSFITGHSLGEYSGLVCAKVIKFEEAVELTEIRGKLMQQSTSNNYGTMQAIIGIKKNIIIEICKKYSKKESISIPVIFNEPKQTIIAGNKNAIDNTIKHLKSIGAKTIPLSISIPAHCILMKPAAKKLKKIIKNIKFNKPIYPIINNNIKYETNPEKIKKYLIKQLYTPINWIKIIQFIENQKIKKIIEIGPGNVLTKLITKITKNIYAKSINNIKDISNIININMR